MVEAGIHLDHHPGEYSKQQAQKDQRTLLKVSGDQAHSNVQYSEEGAKENEEEEEKERKRQERAYLAERLPRKTEGHDDEIFVNTGAAH